MSIFGCLFPCAPQPSWRGALESERCMSERMGASASASQGAEGGAGLGLSQGLPPGLEALGPREKKKRVTGFATLKKKFIRRRRYEIHYNNLIRGLVIFHCVLNQF